MPMTSAERVRKWREKRKRLQAAAGQSSACEDLGVPEVALTEANVVVPELIQPRASIAWDNNLFLEATVPPHSIGAMNKECRFCKGLHFHVEVPTKDRLYAKCCQKGKVPLEMITVEYPDYLKQLLTDVNGPYFRHFLKFIRNYNSALSFASIGGDLERFSRGSATNFRLHGQFYHATRHGRTNDGTSPKYAQLYFIDASIAQQHRLEHPQNQQLKEWLLGDLDAIIRTHNPFARSFKNLKEKEAEYGERHGTTGFPQLQLIFKRNAQIHPGRTNIPRANEISAVFETSDGLPSSCQDIVIYPRAPTGRSDYVTIDTRSPLCEPMCYGIFYPLGGYGWYTNICNLDGQHITMLEYYAAKIAIRTGLFNPLHYGGNLFQQWIIDAAFKVINNDLNFIKNNQKTLRVETYSGMADWLQLAATEQGKEAGTSVILPATFQGSQRCMKQRYKDAILLVMKLGRPDLFITITCNPRWKEITDNLLPGQSPCDRPDLVSRVFSAKLKAIMEDITKKEVFGKVKGWCHSIEFQKRGMPHCHLLLILEDKIETVEDVDRFITAEIPDPDTEPRLYELIRSSMMHGPCGVYDSGAACMQSKNCSKEYPKSFQKDTLLRKGGFPLYRRTKGRTVDVRHKGALYTLDSSWVVPYNKYLCAKYESHINVEACVTVMAVKYIFKYIHKGYDYATVQITGDTVSVDEVSHYIETRYLGAGEAAWKLFKFKMHGSSHNVIRLPVHLPDEQLLYFRSSDEVQAYQRALLRKTMLTAFFESNKTNSHMRTLLYSDVPTFYTFKDNKWVLRGQSGWKPLSRMYQVSPSDVERFCLRLLLLHVTGPTSFVDLRTVEDIVHPTFREACVSLHLLDSDEEWDKCMQESAEVDMPREMRQMFAFILFFNNPANASALWQKYQEKLSEDYAREFPEDTGKSLVMALQDIDKTLSQYGVDGSKYGLPKVTQARHSHFHQSENESAALLSANEVEEQYATLNPEQRYAYDTITEAVMEGANCNKLFFLDGPGGSGKTYLYNCLINGLLSKQKQVLAFATTGIAADLIQGAKTVHSGFKLPLEMDHSSRSAIKRNSWHARVLQRSDLIIIDEATMMKTHALHAIDRILRDITEIPEPFGGKALLLGGDFRQTLPVIKKGTKSDVIDVVIKSSPLWNTFRQLQLTVNQRSRGFEEFNNWVLQVGNRTLAACDEHLSNPNVVVMPNEYMIPEKELMHAVYGEGFQSMDAELFKNAIVVTPTNAEAYELNYSATALLPGEEHVYYSTDSIVENDAQAGDFSTEFLNSCNPSGFPQHRLVLKIGSIVMLIRNMQLQQGLLNGTRLVVEALHRNVIVARVLRGSRAGDRVIIPRIVLEAEDSSLPFKLKRRQFPVILAFAITINKSQGQTFETVGIYLPSPVFSHGQLYVALSRTKNPTRLRIAMRETQGQGRLETSSGYYTQNIVWPEIIR